MKFSYFSAFILSATFIGSVSAVSAADSHHASPHWSYEGTTAPQHWGELDATYALCTTGRQQSPIDIKTAETVQGNLPPLQFHYRLSSATVINNGHTIQVTPDNGGTMTLNGTDYRLVQFHFHTPSEERIDGKPADMVVHLVHKADDGTLAVVAVLIKVGAENPVLMPIFAAMPTQADVRETISTPVDPMALLPATKHYYHYMGSLTTPPCTEGVLWQVMTTPITVSTQQLDDFLQLYPMNARPAQLLNGRPVSMEP